MPTCVYENAYVPPPGGLTIRKVTLGGVGTFSYTVTPSPGRGEVHQAHATTTQPGVPVDAVPSLLSLAPGHYVIGEQKPTSPHGRWHLRHVSCNGASRSTTKPFAVEIHSGQSVVCTFANTFVPRGSISIAKITEGGVGTASFVVTPATGPPTPHLQNATTTSSGVAADAKPQTPADATDNLRLGVYHIVEQPPLSSTGTWTLTTVVCNGVAIPFGQGVADIVLTRKTPHVHCVFTNTFSATPTQPAPPNPGPTPPLPGSPEPAYQVSDLTVRKVATTPLVASGHAVGFRITVKNRGRRHRTERGARRPSTRPGERGGGSHRGRALQDRTAGHLPAGHDRARRHRDHHRPHAPGHPGLAVHQSRRRRDIHRGSVAPQQHRLRPGDGHRAVRLRQLRPRGTKRRPHLLLRPATSASPPGATCEAEPISRAGRDACDPFLIFRS